MSDHKRRSKGKTRRREKRRSRSRDRSRTRTPTPSPHFDALYSTLNSILSRVGALENNSGEGTARNVNGEINLLGQAGTNTLVRANSVPSDSDAMPSVSTQPVLHNNEFLAVLRASNSPQVQPNACDNSEVFEDAGRRVSLLESSVRRDDVVSAAPKPVESLTTTPSSTTQDFIDAIKSLKSSNTKNYFVSNFDPSIHDIDDWCKEVERAKFSNGWDDYECLSRVAGCLKGDARTWLHEWVTNDRSWRNFVLEFKPLCPRRLDYANILYETMSTTSDKYATYAEYARRTLLRLKIVKGLSDELIVLIVIRGITDPQIRAAASNANLSTENLVSFLSIYVKPGPSKQDSRSAQMRKRLVPRRNDIKCFNCGEGGHKSFFCPKKPKMSNGSETKPYTPNSASTCSFCKKHGHTEQTCFAKDRSEPRNQRKVNLCTEPSQTNVNSGNRDITVAVIQGIPIDVLIDSGALNISLISSAVLKYFSHTLKPVSCTLRGIGGQDITVDSYVTLTVEFSDISIEADFVVVPSEFMCAPLIVGTDILNREGVTYVRTKDRQYLTRSNELSNVVYTVVSESLKINTTLEGPEYQRLRGVLSKYSEILVTGTATTTVKTGKMHINLRDDTPVSHRPYKLSHQEKLKVREIIRDLLDKGIIRESTSQYASPIILVKKKDGSDRMCVDYRALNRLTIRERYPLPLIDDHIDRLGKFEYFTSLDMASGFYQIPLDEESIHKTGFVTPESHYEYLKMPFGLMNSPIVYQRIINQTLRPFIESGSILVYIDDVLLLSNTVAEGIELLDQVLQTLSDAGFSVNVRKCSFLTTEVEYLGRLISKGQVRPSPGKVEALSKALPPKNARQVRQFLGLAGYFRRYIKNYATKTSCISALLRKDVPFKWGQEQEQVRQDIITKLTTEPFLAIFDPELPTEVHTDASSVGYGAVLMQTHVGGKKRVVAYFSKSTQGAESKYHSYELETLAVVKALQHFRHYLIGLKFKLVTDCNALKATEKKKDLLPRVARWWIYLQDFTFEIEYRKGVMMSHADYLSRNPICVNLITRPRNWAQIAQAADEETRTLIQQLQEGQLDSTRYVYQNETLYYRFVPTGEEARLLCFIPKGHRLSLLRIFHDEHEHVCAEKTLDLILKHFWFPGIRQFVSKYIAHCLVCVSMKRVPRAPHQPISSWEKPDTPFNTIHADALGPLPLSNGYKFVLVVVDAFSKFCLLYPMCRQDTDELMRALSNTVSLFGIPKLLVADRGRMFESGRFVKWITELGCEIHYITPEMHHSSGQVERYIRTILNMLRIETNHKNESWSDTLWRLQLVLNMTKQKTTQASALNLLVGINGTTPVIRNLIRDLAIDDSQPNALSLREIRRTRASSLLEKNRAQQDSYVNRNRRLARVFQVDDLVFAIKYSQSTGKLDHGMRGPYKVVKVLPSGRYELKLLSGSYGKTTQAAAEYLVPWRGEWCPESCAAFFEYNEADESDAEMVQTSDPTAMAPGTSAAADQARKSSESMEDVEDGDLDA